MKSSGAVIPDTVSRLRSLRTRQMVSTAKRGVALRAAVIVAELIGFLYFGSSALLLDALSSTVDIASSLLLILCIVMADRPPDRHHPFGHGRFEPLAGLQLGVLLSVLGGIMSYHQITAIVRGGSSVIISPNAWMIPLGVLILLEIGYQHLKKTAKQQNSPALLADAVHYRIDGVNSLFAFIALVFAAYFPAYSQLIDHIGAVFIAGLMVVIGTLAAKNNIHQLLDRVPEEKYFAIVRDAAMSVDGVRATEKLLIQLYGPDSHISIDIEVDPLLSVEVAHDIAKAVRRKIQLCWPCVRDVIVHIEPFTNDSGEL